MVILGSTGSIGINALKVAKQLNIEIEALACGSNITLFNKQIKEFNPRFIAISDSTKLPLVESNDSIVFSGEDGICAMLEQCKSQKILNAIVGFAGLQFSLKTLDLKKYLLLANKESLVIAGNILHKKIFEQSHQTILDRIFPIDSEHFSLYALLSQEQFSACSTPWQNHTKTLYITASGGALRDFPIEKIDNASLHDVLQHPTWNMGEKITIDSATLVNKLYEVLEAYWLFNTTKIEAIIERSSLVHALVEYFDGTMKAHLSHADMCLPIAYSMNAKQASKHFTIKNLRLQDLTKICFQEIDIQRYPLWEYKNLLLSYPHLGIVLNASNEVLQHNFLAGKIPFSAFWKIITQVLTHYKTLSTPQTLDEIFSLRNEVTNLSNFLLKKSYFF